MNQKEILKGRKVILRPLSLKDAPRFCQWLKDGEVTKFLALYYDDGPLTLKEERQWISEQRRKNDKVTFAIDSVDGQHIGSCGLTKINPVSKHAEFGIMIGNKKYWSQGCGAEATKILIEYGFKKLKLHRIYLSVLAYNIRGYKAYKKVGFKDEGRKRDHVYRDGHYHDMVLMSILKNEFEKIKRKSYGKKSRKN